MLLLFERQKLQHWKNEQRCSDPKGEKERIILAAVKLLKAEIKQMKCCSEPYPNIGFTRIRVTRIL